MNLESGDRVLVTGASGFIGSAVTRQLVAREQEVVALVEPGADTTNLDGLDVKQVVGDLRRPSTSVQSAVSGCRAVFHVAALYRFWAQDPDAFYAINVDGTRNVLGAADEARRRAARVHEHGRHARARARLGLPFGRRALLPRCPASLRLLQALQVRGRARGAARHRRGSACLARAADLPGRARGSRSHADGQTRARLPERPHAGLRRHRVERRPRRRSGRRAVCWRSRRAVPGGATSSAARI